MKNIENALKNEYREAVSALEFPDKRKLYKLYTEPKHTPVLRRVAVLYAVVTTAIILILALTGAAAFTLYDAVLSRTRDIDITDEKREEMAERLEEWNTTPEEFATGSFDINVNKYGETLGNMFDGVDLFTVGRQDENGFFTGYAYWDDYEYLLMNTSTRNWIFVYNVDGDEIIGKFIEGSSNSGFFTNEELESPDLPVSIRNGDDAEEYIKMAEERLEKKIGKASSDNTN